MEIDKEEALERLQEAYENASSASRWIRRAIAEIDRTCDRRFIRGRLKLAAELVDEALVSLDLIGNRLAQRLRKAEECLWDAAACMPSSTGDEMEGVLWLSDDGSEVEDNPYDVETPRKQCLAASRTVHDCCCAVLDDWEPAPLERQAIASVRVDQYGRICRIVLPELPPSVNGILHGRKALDRWTWGAVRNWWHSRIMGAVKEANLAEKWGQPPVKALVLVKITNPAAGRKRDVDNYLVKSMIDALVAARILEADSPESLAHVHLTLGPGPKPETVVLVLGPGLLYDSVDKLIEGVDWCSREPGEGMEAATTSGNASEENCG